MPGLPQDIAAKVLQADLRSLVKKVSDGGTLTTGERDLVEKFIVPDTPMEDLQRTRLASLLRKWATGGRLNKEELEEIGTLLPSPALPPAETQSDGYQHQQPHYAKVYDTKVRNIKRWIKTGRDRGDPCPLDKPEKMAAWRAKNMPAQKVPDKLMALASRDGVAQSPGPAVNAPSENSAAKSSSSRPEVDLEPSSDDLGFLASFERTEKAEKIAHERWMEALQAPEGSELSNLEATRFIKWQKISDQLRKMQDGVEGARRSQDGWVKIEAYESVDDEVKGVMNQGLRSIMVRVTTKIGLPSEWAKKVEEAYQAELDSVMERMASTDYSEDAFELEAA